MDFYEVYEQHYDRVRKFILASVKNHWVADHLIHETFLRVLQNFSKVRDQAELTSWILGIAANLCQDHFPSPSLKTKSPPKIIRPENYRANPPWKRRLNSTIRACWYKT